MMGDLKHQYLDLLVSIGFASVNSGIKRRPREDKVLLMTSKEVRCDFCICDLGGKKGVNVENIIFVV